MAKKIVGFVKLQVPAGKANPSPPIGPALGQRGLNIMEFCKAFNAQTQGVEPGLPLPVVITAYRQELYFHYQDTACDDLDQESHQAGQGVSSPPHPEGRQNHPRSAGRNRQNQNERHDGRRFGCCCSYHRRLRPFDGCDRGGRVRWPS